MTTLKIHTTKYKITNDNSMTISNSSTNPFMLETSSRSNTALSYKCNKCITFEILSFCSSNICYGMIFNSNNGRYTRKILSINVNSLEYIICITIMIVTIYNSTVIFNNRIPLVSCNSSIISITIWIIITFPLTSSRIIFTYFVIFKSQIFIILL